MRIFLKRSRKALIWFGGGLLALYIIFWIFSLKVYDPELGVSYSPQYARFLGLDAEKTLDAILSDLRPESIRLAVPWSEVERERGTFDFSEIDMMIEKAGASGAHVVLTVGQKVPRWPECYIPAWAGALPQEEKKQALLWYVNETVSRYRDNPTIELWQAGNEPYITFPFGECSLYDIDAVDDEIALIRELDTTREIVVTDSGELSTFRKASFGGDILGTTIYRTIRVKAGLVARYDWIPPAFYKFRARLWGNGYERFFVSELQAEPWYQGDIPTSVGEFAGDETFSNKRFIQNVAYAKRTGASRIYLWGVEWWYFMKERAGDNSYWETAKGVFR